MNCPDEIAVVVAKILRAGILAARSAGWSGDAKRSAIEADHIHNLPLVAADYRPHHLHNYWEVERPSYIKQSEEHSLALFEPLWEELEPLIANLPPGRKFSELQSHLTQADNTSSESTE